MESSLKNIIKNRDLVILVLGQFISKLGSGINGIGLTLYVLKFNNAILGLGLLAILLKIPWIILGPFAGIIADRHSKKYIIIFCDIARGILGILLFLSSNQFEFYLLVFLITLLDVLFAPSVNGILPFIVKKEEIKYATSMYASSGMVAFLIGPAIGGILVGLLDCKSVFLINGISYILSGISEAFIRNKGKVIKEKESKSPFIEIKEGIIYAKEHKNVGFIIIFFAFVSIALGALPIVYIKFIKNDLGASDWMYGFFNTINGLGILLGSFLIPKLLRRWSEINLMIKGTCIYGILFIVFVSLKIIPYNLAIFFLIGISISFINVSYDIFIQKEVEKEFIGRVFSLDITLSNVVMIISIIAVMLIGDTVSNTLMIFILSILLIIMSILGSLKFKKINNVEISDRRGNFARDKNI